MKLKKTKIPKIKFLLLKLTKPRFNVKNKNLVVYFEDISSDLKG